MNLRIGILPIRLALRLNRVIIRIHLDRPRIKRPVVPARVVKPHLQPLLRYRRRQVSHNIPLRVPLVQRQRRAGIRRRARPQRESLMVLTRQHNVFRPRLAKHRRPLIGIPLLTLAIERLRKLVVVVMRPIVLAIVSLGWRPRNPHRVQVPLRIRVVLDVIVVPEIMIRMVQRRPPRHRVEAPVNENPQLRPRIPLRQRMLIQRLDRRLILHRRLRRAHAAHRKNNTCNPSEKTLPT